LFEPVVFGQYTLSLWCEQALVPDSMFVPKTPTKTRVCYQSYLPKCSNGIKVPRVPKFTSVLSDAQPSKSMSPNQASPTSTPSVFRRKTSPAVNSYDPSLYVSPFAQSAPSLLETSPVLAPKPPVPNFVADAAESSLWHVTIYKDGLVVHPGYDVELQNFSWARQVSSWAETKLTKNQLIAIFQDLSTLQIESHQGEETLMLVDQEQPLQNTEVNSCQSKHVLSERANYLDMSSTHVMFHYHNVPNSIMVQNSAQPMCIDDTSLSVCKCTNDQDSVANEIVDCYRSYVPASP